MRCGLCGSKNLIYENLKGKSFLSENSFTVLKYGLVVRFCKPCDNPIMSNSDVNNLDSLLKKAQKISFFHL